MNLLSRVLQSWVSAVLRRPRLVLALAGVLALSSIVFTAAKLGMVTDQLELISVNNPLIRLGKTLEPFRMGGSSSFAVVVQAPTPHRAVDFIGQLSSRIRKDKEHFDEVIFRINPDLFRSRQLLYLDKRRLQGIQTTIDQHCDLVRGFAATPELLGFLRLVNREMTAQMVGRLFTGFLHGKKRCDNEKPFDLSLLIATLKGMLGYLCGAPRFSSPWASFWQTAGQDPGLAGYFWEAHKRYLLAFVTPRSSESGLLGNRDSLVRLKNLIRQTKASFPGVQAGVTGQEALKIDEISTVSRDMAVATWLSLVGVFLLMVVFLRSFRLPCLEIMTLLAGLSWTFGWTTLFIGHLNVLSVVFAPLLCGLGVDYGIHWLVRFEEESSKDPDICSVIARVNERCGAGIFLAGLSGALCFLPLVLTGFRGVVEMGLITGMGIIFTLIATFNVLPALSVVMGPKTSKRPSPPVSRTRRVLIYLTPHRARLILAGAVLISIPAIWGAGRVYFDPNPLNMQSPGADSVIWEKKLMENARRSPLFAAAFAFSPKEAKTKARALEKLTSVGQVESVFSLLPKDQEEKIPLLHSLGRKIPAVRAVVLKDHKGDIKRFIDILERISFKMRKRQAELWGAQKPVAEQMGQVRTLARGIIGYLRSSPDAKRLLFEYRKRFVQDSVSKWDMLAGGATASKMTIRDLPALVKNRFLQNRTYLLQIFPEKSIFERGGLSRFIRDVRGVDPQVCGNLVSFYVFSEALKAASVKASLYAVLLIFIVLMLVFRTLRLALPVLVPLAAGSLWTVGIMGWAGFRFNLVNSIFMPLVVGAGVEYGIIILMRWCGESAPFGHLPFSTGKGVILAALSTTIGFGALMLAHHRGIFSLGFVACEGSLCVLLAAILILPAILTLMAPGGALGRSTRKEPTDLVYDRE